ncbi:LysR family transcriptional regulator [Vibrio maerlii]|uniref:LysR family transcriptional regulator n=1 Tax=Vibrio maerlii TaxID=2231648 RepID=UPI000E3B634D|nr:LysR family transcriptional regulator [Vibrio maerlii]
MTIDYNAAKIYVSVVELGSFSGAAKALNIPVSTVSRKVSELEAGLELRLLERSTRSLRLTDSGETFYEFAQRSIEEAEAGLLAVMNQQQELKGKLRISLPINFEPWWPVLESFQDKYPLVDLEVTCQPNNVDFVNDGIDVALVLLPVTNPNYIVREICLSTRVIVASPHYLEQHGKPNSPEELASHSCISVGTANQDVSWMFDGKAYPITPILKSNDFRLMKYFALQGKGIANIPPAVCARELEAGDLVELFEVDDGQDITFKLVYPRKKLLPSITRVYIDHCIDWINAHENGAWLKTVGMG